MADGVRAMGLSREEHLRRLKALVDAGVMDRLTYEREVAKLEGPPRDAERSPHGRPRPARGGREDDWPRLTRRTQRRGGTRRPERPDLYSSPYRFVPLTNKIVLPEPGNDGSHSEPNEDGFCARLTVEWLAETPLLIGATEKEEHDAANKNNRRKADDDIVEPFRLTEDKTSYAIPGATLRGVVRAALEIVAHGRMWQVDRHFRFGLRDFEHAAYAPDEEDDPQPGREGGRHYPVGHVDEVQAGWLEVRGEGKEATWFIRPCRWGHVEIERLLRSSHVRTTARDRLAWSRLSIVDKYEAFAMTTGRGRSREPSFARTFSVEERGQDNGRDLYAIVDGGSLAGRLVFSDKSPSREGKRFEYIFVDDEQGAPIELPNEVVETFVRLHSKPSRNTPVPDGTYKLLAPLLDRGEKIPVFFVSTTGRQDVRVTTFAFGLTRLFKVPHGRSVGDVLLGHVDGSEDQPVERSDLLLDGPGAHKPEAKCDQETRTGNKPLKRVEADFVENLFGYVHEPKDVYDDPDRLEAESETIAPTAIARRGRVAFSFARLASGSRTKLSEAVSTVMMAPRASFAPFYLVSEAGKPKDYSDPESKLAGWKRYVPRFPLGGRRGVVASNASNTIRALLEKQLDNIKLTGGREASEDVRTRLRFLESADGKPLRFESEIHMHNVTAAEIGAVLWALTHGGDRTKPYRHLVGRARPFGAGQMRIHSIRLAVEPNLRERTMRFVKEPLEEERLDEQGCGFCPAETSVPNKNASLRPFVDEFDTYMRKACPDWPDTEQVREFLLLSDPATGEALAGEGLLDYLPLRRPIGERAGRMEYENPYQELRKLTKPMRPGSPAPKGPRRLLANRPKKKP